MTFGDDLPKKFYGVRVSPKERERLTQWAIQEQWTRERTLKKEFPLHLPLNMQREGWGQQMPNNLVAPGISDRNWSGKGKCVCVMCGYSTTVTNVHRHCPELPADDELTGPAICYEHNMEVHFIIKDGKQIPTDHRTIGMVCVS